LHYFHNRGKDTFRCRGFPPFGKGGFDRELSRTGQGGFYSEIKRNIFLQFAIKPALRKSLRQISENAGYEGSVVLNKVLDGKDDYGMVE
jgi:hypothetical protein